MLDLGRSLDDEVAVGERLQVLLERDARQHGLDLGGLDLAALLGATKRALDALGCGLGGVGVDLDHHDVESGPRRDLGDTGSHQPSADDSDAFDAAHHCSLKDSRTS